MHFNDLTEKKFYLYYENQIKFGTFSRLSATNTEINVKAGGIYAIYLVTTNLKKGTVIHNSDHRFIRTFIKKEVFNDLLQTELLHAHNITVKTMYN